jgi:hypothetical protein
MWQNHQMESAGYFQKVEELPPRIMVEENCES